MPIADNDVVAFGPGVGMGSRGSGRFETLLGQEGLKLVIDADGLNNLAKMKDWPAKCKAKVIMTPHPGEMKRLWEDLFRIPLPPTRQERAIHLAEKTGAIVVLKGAGTVVTDSATGLYEHDRQSRHGNGGLGRCAHRDYSFVIMDRDSADSMRRCLGFMPTALQAISPPQNVARQHDSHRYNRVVWRGI